MPSRDMELTIERGSESYDVLVEFDISSWGSGPTPASWNYAGDPGEGPEFEITHVWIEAPAWSKHLWKFGLIELACTDAEMLWLYEKISEDFPEPSEPDYD